MNYAYLIETIETALTHLGPDTTAEQAILKVLNIPSFNEADFSNKQYFTNLLTFQDVLVRRDLQLRSGYPLDLDQQRAYLQLETDYLREQQNYALCEALYGIAPLSAIPATSRTA